VRGIALGTGDNPSVGGTLLWELHLYGAPVIVLSRVMPIVLSLVLTWWAARRLGPRIMDPPVVVSIVASSLALRLAFEQNLFPYYFMALGVTLIVLDVICGHVRRSLIAWLAVLVIPYCLLGSGTVFGFVNWGGYATIFLTAFVIAGALLAVLLRILRNGNRWHPVAWLVLGCAVVGGWPTANDALISHFPTWLWQLILVPTGLILALGPVLSRVRQIGLATSALRQRAHRSSDLYSLPSKAPFEPALPETL
jgi:hypothetical protein